MAVAKNQERKSITLPWWLWDAVEKMNADRNKSVYWGAKHTKSSYVEEIIKKDLEEKGYLK